MNVTTVEVEEVRELISRHELSSTEDMTIKKISLGAAMEFACCRLFLNGDRKVCERLDAWTRGTPMLAAAFDTALHKRRPTRRDMFVPRAFEFFPVNCRDWDDNDHHLFEGRFDAALRQAGFGRMSKGLVGAFKEMADNIVQHSGPTPNQPARGFIGYHVADGIMSYGVGDVGRGVLESLKENPAWQWLGDSVEALDAIVTKRASRRPLLGEGGGFKQFFKSLADLNGHIVLRSGNGVMRIWGTPNGRRGEKGLATPFPGLQLSVTCSVKETPRELF